MTHDAAPSQTGGEVAAHRRHRRQSRPLTARGRTVQRAQHLSIAGGRATHHERLPHGPTPLDAGAHCHAPPEQRRRPVSTSNVSTVVVTTEMGSPRVKRLHRLVAAAAPSDAQSSAHRPPWREGVAAPRQPCPTVAHWACGSSRSAAPDGSVSSAPRYTMLPPPASHRRCESRCPQAPALAAAVVPACEPIVQRVTPHLVDGVPIVTTPTHDTDVRPVRGHRGGCYLAPIPTGEETETTEESRGEAQTRMVPSTLPYALVPPMKKSACSSAPVWSELQSHAPLPPLAAAAPPRPVRDRFTDQIGCR